MEVERAWWTVEQVATLLGVNQVTVRRWLRSGALKGQMIGGTKLATKPPRVRPE